MQGATSSAKLLIWSSALQQHDASVKYWSGCQNLVADFLSQLRD